MNPMYFYLPKFISFLLILVFSFEKNLRFLDLTDSFVLETVLQHFQFVLLILILFTNLKLQLTLYFIQFTSFLIRFISSLLLSFNINLLYACYFLLFYSLNHFISF